MPTSQDSRDMVHFRSALAVALCLAASSCARRGTGPDVPPASRYPLFPSPLGGQVAVGYGALIDAKGRAVVAGVASDARESYFPAVWRFSGFGRLDKSFGTRGFAALGEEGWAWSVARDPRGRIVLAGFTGKHWKTARRAFAARLLPDGSADGSFGKGGVRLLPSPAGGEHAAAFAVAPLSDGSVLVAGSASDEEGRVRASVWKLRPDGSLDPKFGERGTALLPSPEGSGETRANTLLPLDGRIFVAGHADWKRLAVWRLLADGSLDPGFGRAGLTLTPHGMGRGLLPAGTGGLWVAGFRYIRADGDKVVREEVVLSRLLPDGRPDTEFGPDGALLLRSQGEVKNQESFAIAESGGRLHLAGYVGIGDAVRAALWSFGPAGKPLGPVRILPGSRDGREDRAFAVVGHPGGGVLATGLSKDGRGRRSLAIWRVGGREQPVD